MKKVIKLVIITDAPENEVIRLLETNGHCVSHSEVVEPSWEQVMTGYEDITWTMTLEANVPEEKPKLTEQEFLHKYCYGCGSQRCEGMGTVWFDGCQHRHELEGYEGE